MLTTKVAAKCPSQRYMKRLPSDRLILLACNVHRERPIIKPVSDISSSDNEHGDGVNIMSNSMPARCHPMTRVAPMLVEFILASEMMLPPQSYKFTLF